jgi:hypothetical protein
LVILSFRFDNFLQKSIMTPSLFGEIEVNIRIIDTLFQKLSEKLQQKFVDAITENDDIDLHQIFPNLRLGQYFSALKIF